MTKRKTRVLLVNEASQLSTGFSTIARYMMDKLYSTGKYELFELGNYLPQNDHRTFQLPWKQYLSSPDPRDEEYTRAYNSTPEAQFGSLMFEKVCLDCRPDVVINITDEWMQQFIVDSPFRKNYKYIKMACVDGFPQRMDWMENYKNADVLLTYSKFGKETIEQESGGSIKVHAVVNPGVDHNVFKPLGKKKELRAKYGLPEDANIIVSVMRNQQRKLFPDLFRTLRIYIDNCIANNRPDLAKNTYLLCNTSYPDVGWDLGRHIMESKVGSRVLFIKKCDACGASYAAPFDGEIAPCRKCGTLAARHTNSNDGITREQLAEVYNCGDLYIQYSIAEGFGCPVAEAKSCGIPTMAINHSAMKSQTEGVNGCWALEPLVLFDEPVTQTEQRRALPNNEDTAKKIYKFFCSDEKTKNEWSKSVRKDVEDNYTYERAAKIFEEAIDSQVIVDHELTWLRKDRNFIYPNTEVPRIPLNGSFVDWCIENILKRPDLVNSYWRDSILRSINAGVVLERGGRGKFTREDFINKIKNIVDKHNHWEAARLQHFGLEAKNNKEKFTLV
jgi:glycosyltransferase involved in cell wall biosynthesis